MLDFRNYITSSDPTNLSIELWDTYKRLKNDPYKRQAKYIEKDSEKHEGVFQSHVDLSRIDDFMRVYQGMESARNSGVSKIGRLAEEMLQHSLELLGLKVDTQHKLVENSKRREIDLYLPGVKTYISVTTTPRERKKGDWANELDLLIQQSKLGRIEDWQFVGLMFEGSKSEPGTLEKALRQTSERASVVMVKDIESHAKFLEGLCQRNQ